MEFFFFSSFSIQLLLLWYTALQILAAPVCLSKLQSLSLHLSKTSMLILKFSFPVLPFRKCFQVPSSGNGRDLFYLFPLFSESWSYAILYSMTTNSPFLYFVHCSNCYHRRASLVPVTPTRPGVEVPPWGFTSTSVLTAPKNLQSRHHLLSSKFSVFSFSLDLWFPNINLSHGTLE